MKYITATNPREGGQILDAQVDVTGAEHVEVVCSKNGSVLHVNVNGLCLLRICRISVLEINKEYLDR